MHRSLAALLIALLGSLLPGSIVHGDDEMRARVNRAWASDSRPAVELVPWPDLPVDGATTYRAGETVLFHLAEAPPDRRIRLPRLDNQVRAAVVLRETPSAASPPRAYRQEDLLPLTQSPTEWFIAVPKQAAFPLVVALDLVDPPRRASDGFVVVPGQDGIVALPAHHAMVFGEKLQFEPLPHKNTVGYWVNPDDWAAWRFALPAAGDYHLEILQGCGQGQGGSRMRLAAGEASLEFVVEETGHFQNFRWRSLGTLHLKPGEQRLELRVVEKSKDAVMDVRQIRLVPADGPEHDRPKDISDVAPDLVVPPLFDAPPAAGRRVLERIGNADRGACRTVYLPTDWRAGQSYPLLVELTGNGPFRNARGDVSTGRVEDASLGYGLAGNDGWIWTCVPYLNTAGTAPVTRWWGDPPEYDPRPTLALLAQTVDHLCKKYGADKSRVVLCGFSRGSIAANYLGLHDDKTAALWRGFICFSHYDGVNTRWPYPDAGGAAAVARLQRLGDRPQFILSETPDGGGPSLEATRAYLSGSGVSGRWTFASTGFPNHSDQWALRPCPAREQVREWMRDLASPDH